MLIRGGHYGAVCLRNYLSPEAARESAIEAGWAVINDTEARHGKNFLILVDYEDEDRSAYWRWVFL